MSGHLERLEAMLAQLDKHAQQLPCRCDHPKTVLGEILAVSVDCDAGHGNPVGAGTATGEDLRAAVAELKQLRAEREGWRDGASQRLRHAYRSGWEERGETIAAAVSAFAGHGMAEQRAKAYVDEWWDVAPEQPMPDGGEQP